MDITDDWSGLAPASVLDAAEEDDELLDISVSRGVMNFLEANEHCRCHEGKTGVYGSHSKEENATRSKEGKSSRV